jgi:hypothetical protein
MGEQVLQSMGLSPQAAALTYAALGLSPAAVEGILLNRTINAQAAAYKAAKDTYATNGGAVSLADRAAELRQSLNVGGGRNSAVAQFKIDGATGELVGVSGQAVRPGTVPAPTSHVFNTIQTGNNPRTLDAEYKILEQLATQLTSTSRGVVNLYSELPVCVSCSSVITQFQQKFPNVVVNVTIGKP